MAGPHEKTYPVEGLDTGNGPVKNPVMFLKIPYTPV